MLVETTLSPQESSLQVRTNQDPQTASPAQAPHRTPWTHFVLPAPDARRGKMERHKGVRESIVNKLFRNQLGTDL